MEGAEVAALARQHKKLTWQRIGIVAGLTLIAAAAFVISNFVGAIDISPGAVSYTHLTLPTNREV